MRTAPLIFVAEGDAVLIAASKAGQLKLVATYPGFEFFQHNALDLLHGKRSGS